MEATTAAAPPSHSLSAFLDVPASAVPSAFRNLDTTFREWLATVPAADAEHLSHATEATGRAHATDAGRAAVPLLVEAFGTAPADRLPHVVMLLALLADTDAHDAVRAGLAPALALFDGAASDRRLVAALLHLAGFFPEERDRVLAAAAAAGLSADDASRLDQSVLAERPEQFSLAREWPSPAIWALTAAEIEADRRNWIVHMPPSEIGKMWDGDTRKLRDYTAQKAIALLDTPPAPYTGERDVVDPEADLEPQPAPGASGPAGLTAVDLLARFEKLLACPDCRGPLSLGGEGAHCAACATLHPATPDWLDLSSAAGQGTEAMILNDPGQAARYERGLRPAFLRVMGRDFDNLFTVDDEIAFLARHLQLVSGPVLDLAGGTGRFTRALAELVEKDQLIALDLSTSMLGILASGEPRLPAVRASALALPFADGSLSAVSCWNALQTLPDQGAVIAEVGRVLADGGTFTLFTFEPQDDPLYRQFQRRHEVDLRVSLRPLETIREWLAAAGLTVREEYRPAGGYLLLAAVRDFRS